MCYIQQPHAVLVPGTQQQQQVVVAFVAQNSIWAFSASVEHLQSLLESTRRRLDGVAAEHQKGAAAEKPKDLPPPKFVAGVIFSGAGTSSWPRVSPDGQQIAFSNDQSGDSEIYVVRIACVPLSASGDIVAVQASGQPRRITYLSSSSFSIGWSSAKDFFTPTTETSGGVCEEEEEEEEEPQPLWRRRPATPATTIHFASDYHMTNVASETVWAVDAAGGNPRRSGQLGESDFYHFCKPLQLHIVGRFTRDTHCTKTWKGYGGGCFGHLWVASAHSPGSFMKLVLTPRRFRDGGQWNLASPGIVGTRVFFIADVARRNVVVGGGTGSISRGHSCGSGNSDESQTESQPENSFVITGCANVFSFDLAEHFAPFARLKRDGNTVIVEIPSSAITQHTFFTDFPCRNLTACSCSLEAPAAAASSSSDDSGFALGNNANDREVSAAEVTKVSDRDEGSTEESTGHSSTEQSILDEDNDGESKQNASCEPSSLDDHHNSAASTADRPPVEGALVFFQQGGCLHVFSCAVRGAIISSEPVSLANQLFASSAKAMDSSSLVIANDGISAWIEYFDVHPDGHSLAVVCRDQVAELGLFSGPCVRIPTCIPHVRRSELFASSADPAELAMAAAAEFATGSGSPYGHVVDIVQYLADGRIILVLSPNEALQSAFCSFNDFGLEDQSTRVQHTQQIIAIVGAPPLRDSMTLVHVHVLRRRVKGSQEAQSPATLPIGKIDLVVPCPGDSGLVLLRDDNLQLIALYIPPNQSSREDSSGNASGRQKSQPLQHPDHKHPIARRKAGSFFCDVCGKEGLNARRHPRYHCAKGCNWDVCGKCLYEDIDHPDILADKQEWLARRSHKSKGGRSGAVKAGGAVKTAAVGHKPALITPEVIAKQVFLEDHDRDVFATAASSPKRSLGLIVGMATVLDRGSFLDGVSGMCFGPAGEFRRTPKESTSTTNKQWGWDSWSTLAEPAKQPDFCVTGREGGTRDDDDHGQDHKAAYSEPPPQPAAMKRSLAYWYAYVKNTSTKTSAVLVANLAPLVGMLHYVYHFGVEPSSHEPDLQLLPDPTEGDYELYLDGQWYGDGTAVPHNVSGSAFWSTSPSFDPQGNFLYFLSARYFRPQSDFFGEAMTFQETQRPFLVRLARNIRNPFLRNPWVPRGGSDEPDNDSSSAESSESVESSSDESDEESSEVSSEDSSQEPRNRRSRPRSTKKKLNKVSNRQHGHGQGAGRSNRNLHPKVKMRKSSSSSMHRAQVRARPAHRHHVVHGKSQRMLKTQSRKKPVPHRHSASVPNSSEPRVNKGGKNLAASLDAHVHEIRKNRGAVDLDGISSRTHVLPGTKVRRYTKIHGIAGNRVVYARQALAHAPPASDSESSDEEDGTSIHVYSIDEQEESQLVANAMNFELSLNGSALVYTESSSSSSVTGAANFSAINPNDVDSVADSDSDDERHVNLDERVSVVVDPTRERAKVFSQICGAVRRQMTTTPGMFAALGGPNCSPVELLGTWNKIEKRYRERVLLRTSSDTDFGDMVTEMLAELRVSHVSYFPSSDGSFQLRRGEGHEEFEDQGFLCCDSVWNDALQGYILSEIYAGDDWDTERAGPLAYLADVFHVGDLVLSVDGTRLTSCTTMELALQHHAGNHLIVEFVPVCCVEAFRRRMDNLEQAGRGVAGFCGTDHSHMLELLEGLDDRGSSIKQLYCRTKKVWVRAVDEYQDRKVRDRDRHRAMMAAIRHYCSANLRALELAPQISYVQVADMTRTGFAEFHRVIATRTAGLIIDIRGNTGGSVAEQLLRFLSVPQLGWDVGAGVPVAWPANSTKPPSSIVLMVDANCYSDADALAFAWKQLDLGRVVGCRTFGGLLSVTGEFQLLDGSELTLPSEDFLPLQPNAARVENVGVVPDIVVDFPPSLLKDYQDPQLEQAVDVLVKLMRRK